MSSLMNLIVSILLFALGLVFINKPVLVSRMLQKGRRPWLHDFYRGAGVTPNAERKLETIHYMGIQFFGFLLCAFGGILCLFFVASLPS